MEKIINFLKDLKEQTLEQFLSKLQDEINAQGFVQNKVIFVQGDAISRDDENDEIEKLIKMNDNVDDDYKNISIYFSMSDIHPSINIPIEVVVDQHKNMDPLIIITVEDGDVSYETKMDSLSSDFLSISMFKTVKKETSNKQQIVINMEDQFGISKYIYTLNEDKELELTSTSELEERKFMTYPN